jgi:MYXO-CTERM domain-containing protein
MKKLAILGLVLLLGLGLGVSAYAQESGTGGTGGTAYGDTARTDDDGMDLGWIGLLGLGGLLGLRRREVHRDVRTTAPASR